MEDDGLDEEAAAPNSKERADEDKVFFLLHLLAAGESLWCGEVAARVNGESSKCGGLTGREDSVRVRPWLEKDLGEEVGGEAEAEAPFSCQPFCQAVSVKDTTAQKKGPPEAEAVALTKEDWADAKAASKDEDLRLMQRIARSRSKVNFLQDQPNCSCLIYLSCFFGVYECFVILVVTF